ncbi:DMT family transporter [Pseudogemmobacter sonorensis]|uniref:DMT family transporter n=1 Tax=Pseudogemmobacter sonorensis TaxID=2989681 RepID=UPI0036C4D4BA
MAQVLHDAPLRGVLLAAGAAVAFSVNDLAIKFLSAGYALHQLMLIRAGIALSLILSLAAARPGGMAGLLPRRPAEQLLRALVILVSNICFYTGLAVMPFADAVAVGFVSPLILVLLSVLFLGERIGPRRWSAILIGFLGVVVMLRPGAGALQPAALLVLASAFLYALGYLMTRHMRGSESALGLSVWMQVAFILTSGAMGICFGEGRFEAGGTMFSFLLRPWIWPPPEDWPWFVLAGLSVAIGSVMITQAFRLAEAGLVAPMEYIGMPMAIFWGLAVFGTWPDAVAWAGIALICGSGLYMIWRETRPRRKENP